MTCIAISQAFCSFWFHYIVSLGISVQCNTRSGLAFRERQDMGDCGFPQHD